MRARLNAPRRHTRRVLAPLLAALACTHGGGAPAEAAEAWFPPDSAVRAILTQRIEAGQGVGLVVGLLENGRTRIVTAGTSGAPGGRPLDGATVFEIGSVTKVFTTALLADMVRLREVRLEQRVAELLPKSVTVPARGDTAITLLDLATQHSGLPRQPANFAPADPANPYADYTEARLYDFLSHHTMTRAPGTVYEYSNLGMGLLGHALAVRSGKPYETILTERVLKPLGLTDTRITLTADMKTRLAPGHDVTGAVVPNWDFKALAGAGALRSTANDMLRFLAANLDSGTAAIYADLRETHRLQLATTNAQTAIGLAWQLSYAPGSEIVWHNGGTGGYRSFIGFDPSRRVGVVLLSNMTGALDDIGFHLLFPKLPLQRFVKRTEVKVDATKLDALVGQYELAPTFVMTVTHEGDGLFIQATGQPKFPVYAESDSTFFYKVVEAQVSFQRDETGKVTQITLHQNGRNQPGRRLP